MESSVVAHLEILVDVVGHDHVWISNAELLDQVVVVDVVTVVHDSVVVCYVPILDLVQVELA